MSTHQQSGIMAGKKGLIMGVANKSSIAWGIAEKLHQEGAELAFTYPSDIFEKRVRPLASTVGSDMVFPCDVADETQIARLFTSLAQKWSSLDFIVHAIAFSDKNELKGQYVDTSHANFMNTMNVSCFSFTSIARHAKPLMKEGGSLLTLTYHGANKVMPHYNVMGVAKAALEASVRYLATDLGPDNIRVNGLSAGPIKTLAASGIGDFGYILTWNQLNAPLKRNVTLQDIAGSALYLLSDLSSGVTGEIHHVDAGYHVVGMKRPDAPDIHALTA
ncbi:enoyl-ACP reductase FabI [bacterium NHP-B]|nr:enoyl-ACP reductase FabI [bacterium NHP-B]